MRYATTVVAVTMVDLAGMDVSGRLVDLAVSFGTVALTFAAVYLWNLGRRAYGNEEVRRRIGVQYDLCTFWPRQAHPLAPPCYMERTVPDLLRRLESGPGTRAQHILLSCHSQGSVVG